MFISAVDLTFLWESMGIDFLLELASSSSKLQILANQQYQHWILFKYVFAILHGCSDRTGKVIILNTDSSCSIHLGSLPWIHNYVICHNHDKS